MKDVNYMKFRKKYGVCNFIFKNLCFLIEIWNLIFVYYKEFIVCSRVSNEFYINDFILMLFFSFYFKDFGFERLVFNIVK